MTPVTLSLLILLPIELMTFGMYFFTFNPHPMTIKPVSYIILIGLHAVMILWAFILLIVGTKVGNQIILWKSVLIVAILCGCVLSGIRFGGAFSLKIF